MNDINDNLNRLRNMTSTIPMNNELYDLLNQLIVEVIKINNRIDNAKDTKPIDYFEPIDMSIL